MQDDGSASMYGGIASASPDGVSPPIFDAPPRNPGSKSSIQSNSSSSTVPMVAHYTVKTDKPRPHQCATCLRCFARLEHLKRHERSHTKEKPFACSECTRCFARRDLLLRHQQKLHSTTTPSSRPRNGRRESMAAGSTARVRKNSVANNAASAMRPRANTLSHVDASTIGMLANTNPAFNRHFMPGHSHHSSLSGLHGTQGYSYRGMSTSNHASSMGLPKLETSGLPTDLSSGLRTAPAFGSFGAEFGMAYSHGQGNTINPHALHMNGMNGLGIDHGSPFHHMFYPSGGQPMGEDDGAIDWMAQGFETQMNFHQGNENAIDDSSPSAMSTNSPAGPHDIGSDMHTGSVQHQNLTNGNIWQHVITNPANLPNSPINMDFTSNFNEIVTGTVGTISPKSLLAQGGPGFDINLPTPPDMNNIDGAGVHYQSFQLPFNRDGGASTASTASMDSSLHQSSVTTTSSDLVSDGTRGLLIAGLSLTSPFGQRKYSQPMISSPLSPESMTRNRGFNMVNFPSTQDLQKYVAAYIKYFHPHLPFLHIPTLNFESPEYTMSSRGYGNHLHMGHGNVAGGGSCLVLSIAAIGAVYEREMSESRELFECAKRLISSYLEERRKANLSRTQYGPRTPADSEDTPLWLVQAMLLNVIYGHNCGDKTAAELASNHCAALVSLARGAELARPYPPYAARRASNQNQQFSTGDPNGWTSMINENEEVDWFDWRIMEERKRTLYAVFILSSMLVTAYNHAPALTNSEIRLDLPCDEDMWAAENSQTWLAMGGARQADSRIMTFATALTHLLMSSQRHQRRNQSSPQEQSNDESDLRPSTFGCLVLVNALHNYIWETRQRHLGRQWTDQETAQMQQHIEPALRAWQASWASDPSHSLERPNPFGAGPLSADSIPLLDLAYVRLYINLGRSKEAFWQRDFDAMADEIAAGPEFDCISGGKNEEQSRRMSVCQTDEQEGVFNGEIKIDAKDNTGAVRSQPTKRESQLRQAALYATDSLLMSEKLGLNYMESTARELPAQSAMCAFDCAQVLAEWVTTLQERIGTYVGVIGKDEMDLMTVPGILLLEDEDRQLLGKIGEFLNRTEERVGSEPALKAFRDSGYGGRLLVLIAHLLERGAVWPVTKLMAHSLKTQATHLKDRALASTASTR